MEVASRIIGSLFLLFGIINLYHGYRLIRIRGNVMLATVSRLNFLPLIVGIGLLESGNLWFLLAIPIVWILSSSILFPAHCFYLFPSISGLIIGFSLFKDIFPDSRWWYWGGGLIGAIAMFIIASIVVAIITGGRPASVDRFSLRLRQ